MDIRIPINVQGMSEILRRLRIGNIFQLSLEFSLRATFDPCVNFRGRVLTSFATPPPLADVEGTWAAQVVVELRLLPARNLPVTSCRCRQTILSREFNLAFRRQWYWSVWKLRGRAPAVKLLYFSDHQCLYFLLWRWTKYPNWNGLLNLKGTNFSTSNLVIFCRSIVSLCFIFSETATVFSWKTTRHYEPDVSTGPSARAKTCLVELRRKSLSCTTDVRDECTSNECFRFAFNIVHTLAAQLARYGSSRRTKNGYFAR